MPEPLAEPEFLTELLRIADRLEPEAREALLASIREAQYNRTELERAITIGTIAAILAAIPLSEIGGLLYGRIRLVIARALDAAAVLAARRFLAVIGEAIDPQTVAYAASVWAQGHAATLVEQVMAESRTALQAVIADVLRDGVSLDEAVFRIEQVIGLTERQALAVERYYRELLVEGLSRPHARRLAAEYAQRLLTHRAVTIARTEMAQAVNKAQQLLWIQAKRRGLLSSEHVREWTAILGDGRLCQICHAAHGTRAEIGGKFPNGLEPGGAHARCLPGHVPVTTPEMPTAFSERFYDGPLIRLRTAGGHDLACTPNHPILTPSGWKPAQLLQVGDEVVCCPLGDPAAIWHGEHQQRPTPIADIADALRLAGKVAAVEVPTTAEDFHGDGLYSEVAVVWADSTLRDRFVAARHQQLVQRVLQGAVGLGAALSASRRLAQSGVGHLAPARCIVCGAHLVGALLRAHSQPLETFLLTGRSEGYAFAAQEPSDSSTRDAVPAREADNRGAPSVVAEQRGRALWPPSSVLSAAADAATGQSQMTDDSEGSDSELACQLARGEAGSVETHQLVAVRVEGFTGQVYNLETRSGWYAAAGIITHNCRCSARLVLRSDPVPSAPAFVEPADGGTLRPAA